MVSVLGAIGLIVVIGSHYGFLSVSTGWYYFWLVITILDVIGHILEDNLP